MPRKSASNGSAPPSPGPPARPLGPLSILADKEKLKQREEDVTKINNMNAFDLKNACDDALKRVRFSPARPPETALPSFTQGADLFPFSSSSLTLNYFDKTSSIQTCGWR